MRRFRRVLCRRLPNLMTLITVSLRPVRVGCNRSVNWDQGSICWNADERKPVVGVIDLFAFVPIVF